MTSKINVDNWSLLSLMFDNLHRKVYVETLDRENLHEYDGKKGFFLFLSILQIKFSKALYANFYD